MKALILISIFACSCFGQLAGNPDNWCREGFFTRESDSFSLGLVKTAKGSRAYFYDDASEKCPNDASCKRKAFVVAGDQVLINRVRGDFACAWFAPAKGSPTIGWLRLADIDRPAMLLDASEAAWSGEWKYGDSSISIAPHKLGGYLSISGQATWKGVGNNVNVGELSGRFEHKDGVLNYSDGTDENDCKARMNLLGGYLIVSDNMKCGGLNVSFSGIYRKAK
jgi:hypothetical protein